MRIKQLWITAAVATAALAVAAQQDAVLLRRELKENSVETYRVSLDSMQNIDVPAMGPMDIGMKGSYDWVFSTKAVDQAKKTADLEMTVKDMKLEFSGPMAMPEMENLPKEVKSPVKLDDRYRLTQSSGPNLDVRMILAMGASAGLSPFIELPEGPVKPGDHWEVVMPKSAIIGNPDLKLKATFKGAGTLDQKTGNLIEMAGSIPLDIDIAKLMEQMAKSGADPSGGMAAGMNMTMKGTMEVKVASVLDRTTGKILASHMTVGTNSTMTLVDMGMTMPVKGTMTMKLVAQ